MFEQWEFVRSERKHITECYVFTGQEINLGWHTVDIYRKKTFSGIYKYKFIDADTGRVLHV